MRFRSGMLKGILESYGYETVTRGKWLMMLCPFHSEENISFGIDSETGGFNCFACHKTGIFKELKGKLGIDIIDYDDVIDHPKILNYDNVFKRKLPKKVIEYNFNSFRNFSNIKRYRKIYDYINLKRGISRDIIWKLNVGVIIGNKKFKSRVVVPVYDKNGKNIMFYEGRTILNVVPKYYRTSNEYTSRTLYNYHLIKSNNHVVVGEGVFDSIKHYGESVTNCFGANISNYQLTLLSYFEKVYFCFDNDKAGISALNKLIKKIDIIDDKGTEYYYILLKRGTDLFDTEKIEYDMAVNIC